MIANLSTLLQTCLSRFFSSAMSQIQHRSGFVGSSLNLHANLILRQKCWNNFNLLGFFECWMLGDLKWSRLCCPEKILHLICLSRLLSARVFAPGVQISHCNDLTLRCVNKLMLHGCRCRNSCGVLLLLLRYCRALIKRTTSNSCTCAGGGPVLDSSSSHESVQYCQIQTCLALFGNLNFGIIKSAIEQT